MKKQFQKSVLFLDSLFKLTFLSSYGSRMPENGGHEQILNDLKELNVDPPIVSGKCSICSSVAFAANQECIRLYVFYELCTISPGTIELCHGNPSSSSGFVQERLQSPYSKVGYVNSSHFVVIVIRSLTRCF